MKKTILNQLLFGISCISFSNGALSSSCELDRALESAFAGKLDAVDDLVCTCNESRLSALELGQLAYLYGLGYARFESEELRSRRVFELFNLSTLKGEEDSIVTIASVYENGNSLIGLEPNLEVSSCLYSLVEKEGGYGKSDVQECLNLRGQSKVPE